MQFVEHRLKQKLIFMENAVARLSSMKSELRSNAEQARKDIASAIGHQLSCIRAREQELMSQLDTVIAAKEESFCGQQEILSQAIGACQQSLKSYEQCDVSKTNEMLLRLNTISLKPQNNPHVAFEFDPSDYRRAASEFGMIVTEKYPKDSESLPMDIEEYDGNVLTHKSVMRLPWQVNKIQTSPSNSYCQHDRSSAETDDGFEFVRDRRLSVLSDGGSSIEVIRNHPHFFEDHINEVISSPSSVWLQTNETVEEDPRADNDCIFNYAKEIEEFQMEQTKPVKEIESENRFQFGNVIQSIQKSCDTNWLVQKITPSLEASMSQLRVNSDESSQWLRSGKKLEV